MSKDLAIERRGGIPILHAESPEAALVFEHNFSAHVLVINKEGERQAERFLTAELEAMRQLHAGALGPSAHAV